MELHCNEIVQLRNGKFGVVACFNEKPFQLVFDSYTTPIGRYDGELKHKKSEYDIIKVYNGTPITNVLDVFKKRFSAENLEVVMERV